MGCENWGQASYLHERYRNKRRCFQPKSRACTRVGGGEGINIEIFCKSKRQLTVFAGTAGCFKEIGTHIYDESMNQDAGE